MDSTIITALITAGTTLIVSIGTWHVSAKASKKKDQEELRKLMSDQKDELQKMIEGYRKELHDKFDELQEDVTKVNADVQQHIAVITVKIDELSNRVEKHNQVIDRTGALEERTNQLVKQIDRLEGRV